MDKQILKDLVGRGELEQAFEAMLDHGKNQKATLWYNTLLIQYNQFRELEQDKLKGVLSAEEASLVRNRILSALLSLIDDLPGEQEGGNQDEPLTPDGGKIRWPLWLVIGAVVLLGLMAGYTKLNFFATEKEAELPPAESIASEEKLATIGALHFPEGNMVTFILSTGDEIEYRLLNGELKSLGGDVRRVSFTIRCSARKGYGVNFWDETFRLELDESGALLAPSSGLNEMVANNSFKDGTVSFEAKGRLSNMKLAITNPWNKKDIRELAISLE